MLRYPRRARALAPALLLAVAASTIAVAAPPDRLERFRQLAGGRLSLAQILESDGAIEAYRDVYGLIDEEIVESLASGSVFASAEFLQDRLDAFGEAWGGAALTVTRVGRLLVGAFALGQSAAANSVRVYGRMHDEVALLAALHREGRPTVTPLPADGGTPQFFVAWEGAPSGRGPRPLRVDLIRHEGDEARIAWTTAELFPDGLHARTWSVRGSDVRVRYELRYPGWTAGCEEQTEQEDVYRLEAGGSMARVSRLTHNAWHRQMRADVERLFAAIGSGDAEALTALVPDRELRGRLPALVAEPACDASDGPGRQSVTIAATTAGQRPWTLTFRRAGAAWRLVGAGPLRY